MIARRDRDRDEAQPKVAIVSYETIAEAGTAKVHGRTPSGSYALTMANLKLRVTRAMEVVNADAEIEVRTTDNELLGRLLVSRGSIDWVGANKQLRHRMTWRKFAKVMETEGRRIR